MAHDPEVVAAARELLRQGLSATAVAHQIKVPRSTVQDWTGRELSTSASLRECPECFDRNAVPADAYAYLLGMYLGDGCISRHPRTFRLRVFLDGAYPGIVAECASAIKAVLPGKQAWIGSDRSGRGVVVSSYSQHWPCLLPQHAAGRKHLRRIKLMNWQLELLNRVSAQEGFIRGLIHSDGTRIVATERKGSYIRRAPRYAFSNLSKDIQTLFCAACDRLGITWTQPSANQIAIYRKAAVAKLDEFVGPKR